MTARWSAGQVPQRTMPGRPSLLRPIVARSVVCHGGELIARADRATMSALPAWRSPRGVAAAHAVSGIAEPLIAAPVILAAAVAARRRGGWRAAWLPVLLIPGGVFVRWLLSEVIARPRPPEALWLAEPKGYSLPSRHTTVAALTAGAIAAGATGVPRHGIPLVAAASVGASRVYLGVHWPSDVLAGWLFAATWLGLARRILPARQWRGCEEPMAADTSRSDDRDYAVSGR